MCGRYVSARSADEIAGAFGLGAADVEERLAPDHNVAPTKDVYAVIRRPSAVRPVLTVARWGLPAPWAGGRTLINARVEAVDRRPAFARALHDHRCLLPADGWYEWSAGPGGSRRPYYVSPDDGSVLALAGVWADVPDLGRVCAIVTGPATGELRSLHDRSPLAVPAPGRRAWLDPSLPGAALLGALRAATGCGVHARPVDRAVNDVRNNGPALLDPPAADPQAALF